MKLAEALIIRSDLQQKLYSLQSRLSKNTTVQEGNEPTEDPNLLLKEILAVHELLHELILKIHRTNADTVLNDGRNLLTVLNERDKLLSLHKILNNIISQATDKPDRYSAREIKWETVIDVADYQKQADDIAKKVREINILIQAGNWQVDLIE